MSLPKSVKISGQLVKFSGRVRRDAIEPANPAVREDGEGDGVIRGVVATEAEVVHWVPGAGPARIVLEISETIVNGWGIDSLPMMKDHRRDVDAIIGRMRNLRAADGELWFDADFDPELGATYKGAVERGTITDLSVTADIFELALAEPETDDKLPLYRAIAWKPAEGSLVWRGADGSATFRRARMTREDIAQMLRAAGMEATDEQIDAAMAKMAPIPDEETESEVKRDAPEPASATLSVSPEQLTDLVAAAVTSAVTRHFSTLTPDAPAPVDPAQAAAEKAMKNAVTAARKFGLPDKVIEDHKAIADGNAETFGLLTRAYLAEHQKVPSVVPRRRSDSVQGGFDNNMNVLRDLVTCVRARAGNVASIEAAEKAGLDPHRYSIWGWVETFMRANDPSLGVVGDRFSLIEAAMSERADRSRGFHKVPEIVGAQFARDARGALVPADLPSAFTQVVHLSVMDGHNKEVLDLSKYSTRMDVDDFRDHRIVWYDVAGDFNPLAAGEALRPLSLRELEGRFKVDNYGHILTITYQALVDDNLDILVNAPGRVGVWCGSMKNKVFAKVIANGSMLGGGTAYTGDRDISVPDPGNFDKHLEQIWNHATSAVPVPASPSEDPRNDPGQSYALVPSVMLYGKGLRRPWFKYMAPLTQTIDRESLRDSYEQGLFRNSDPLLYLGHDSYHLYPGPGSYFCPVMHGSLRNARMSTRVLPTGGREQDGIDIRCVSTFATTLVHPGIYRVRKAS